MLAKDIWTPLKGMDLKDVLSIRSAQLPFQCSYLNGHQLDHLHHLSPIDSEATITMSKLVLTLVIMSLLVVYSEQGYRGFGSRRRVGPRVYFTHRKVSYGPPAYKSHQPSYREQGFAKSSVDDWNYYKPGVQEARQRDRSQIGEYRKPGSIEPAYSLDFGPNAEQFAKAAKP